MTSVKGPPPLDVRRLANAADRAANADGKASADELARLAEGVQQPLTLEGTSVMPPPRERLERLGVAVSLAETSALATLDPALAKLPEPLRKLALEIDGLWGDADGRVSVEEIDRIARYTLLALPFFVKEAACVVELAAHLGLDDGGGRAAPSVLSLRLAVAEVDREEVARGAEFKKHFDEAVAQGEVPGLPELLRDAANHHPKWHSLGVLEHTAYAVAAGRELALSLGLDWKDVGAVMLLHDLGKITQRHDRAADDAPLVRFDFVDHESAGAEWLKQRGVSDDVVFHVRNHIALRNLEPSEMEALCQTKERLAQAVVVYVADQIAKGSTPAQLDSFAAVVPKIMWLGKRAGLDVDKLLGARRELLARWFDVPVGSGTRA